MLNACYQSPGPFHEYSLVVTLTSKNISAGLLKKSTMLLVLSLTKGSSVSHLMLITHTRSRCLAQLDVCCHMRLPNPSNTLHRLDQTATVSLSTRACRGSRLSSVPPNHLSVVITKYGTGMPLSSTSHRLCYKFAAISMLVFVLPCLRRLDTCFNHLQRLYILPDYGIDFASI